MIRNDRKIITIAAFVVNLFNDYRIFALALKFQIYALEVEKQMIAAFDHGWRMLPNLKIVTNKDRDLLRGLLLIDELRCFDAAVIKTSLGRGRCIS